MQEVRLGRVVVGVLGLLVAGGVARAEFVPGATLIDPELPGETRSDIWPNASLTAAANPGFGGFPGTDPWPSGIASSEGSVDRSAELVRLSGFGSGGFGGGPFPLSSIYFGSMSYAANAYGGTLAVQDASPLAGVSSIVFQIQIGEVTGYDFWDGPDDDSTSDLPVLRYNGGTDTLAPSVSLVLDRLNNGKDATLNEDIFINTYLVQWDLTGLGTIDDFSIEFSGVQHAQVYAMRLDQSDTYAPVPEPATLGLTGAAGCLLLLRRRRG